MDFTRNFIDIRDINTHFMRKRIGKYGISYKGYMRL